MRNNLELLIQKSVKKKLRKLLKTKYVVGTRYGVLYIRIFYNVEKWFYYEYPDIVLQMSEGLTCNDIVRVTLKQFRKDINYLYFY
jgi:hypothetical protein